MMEISFGNRKIQFTETQALIFGLQKKFKELGIGAANEFIRSFDQKYNSSEDVHHEVFTDGLDYITLYVDDLVSIIIEKGEFDINNESFIDDYFSKYSNWDSVCSEYSDKYNDILYSENKAREYRENRKASRGSFQGGGFGIGGALKGMAMAGTANLVSGAIHSVVNTAGNAVSGSHSRNALDQLFHNENARLKLASGIVNDTINLVMAFYDVMIERNHLDKSAEYSDEDKSKSNRIFENVKNGRISDLEKIELALLQSIELYPKNEAVYIYCLENFPQKKREIKEISQFCGVDVNRRFYETLLDIYSECDTADKESVNTAIDKIHKKAKEIGCDDYSKIIEQGESYLRKIDEKARTYENHVYETVALANEASAEWEMLSKCIATIEEIKTVNKFLYSEKLIELVCDLRKGEYVLKNIPFIVETIDETINAIETELCNFDGFHYENKIDAKIAYAEKSEIEKEINSIESGDLKSINELKEKITSTNWMYKGMNNYIEELSERQFEIENEDITLDGVIYDNLDSFELASKTEKNFMKIKSLFLTDKNQSVFFKPDFRMDKIKAFCKRVESSFDTEIFENEILAYFDDTLLGIGDVGLAITKTDLVITKDNLGIFSLTDIKNVSISGSIGKKLGFSSISSGKSHMVTLTQGDKGVQKIFELLNYLIKMSNEVSLDESSNEGGISAIYNQVKLIYQTDKDQHIYFMPNLVTKKIQNFCKRSQKYLKVEIAENEIMAYFDETVFGKGDVGVAVTATNIVITVDDLGVFPLKELSHIETKGVIGKDLVFKHVPSNKTYKLKLTQGNKGVVKLAEFLNYLVEQIIK